MLTRLTEATHLLPVELASSVALFWLVLGVVGLASIRVTAVIIRIVFPLGALAALVMAALGATALASAPSSAILPIGLPDLPAHLRLDALSAFFLMLLGTAAFGVSTYAAGYVRHLAAGTLSLLTLWYFIFLASMALVILADDAYVFMVAWESMALSSYFLVVTDHRIAEIRRAGFLYLLMAHVGAVSLLLSFGVMQGGGQGQYSFDYMRSIELVPFWASAAFLAALFGFGAKAGLVPLHVWLPEAHPAAPSPVSALMSGVMLKTAVYGFLRVSFDLLGVSLDWWGLLVLAVGLLTAIYGVIFAAVQSDMKRLLAWSSIENLGFIMVGIGLAMVFHADGKDALAALAMTAALFHSFNHALFKGLLFLGTGSVLHATNTRRMADLGGMMRYMPWTGWLTLIGALSIAGLPPLNGFASEWMLLQAFLLSPGLSQPHLNMIIPVAAGLIAMSAALAAYVMVKFFGVIFLGQPRSNKMKQAHEACWHQRLGMLWLAFGCVALGLMPTIFVDWLAPAIKLLFGQGLNAQPSWLLLSPVDAERSSYSPVVFLLVALVVLAITVVAVRKLYHPRTRRADPWDCGYPEQDARMQDSAEGFGQPIRRVFDVFMRVERQTPSPFDRSPVYRGGSLDALWALLYVPIARWVAAVSDRVGKVQHGRIQWYLVYSFATLLFLLIFTR